MVLKKWRSLDGLLGTYYDGRIDESGVWNKVLALSEVQDLYGGGSGNTYSGGASGFGWGMYDFGATDLRWLTVAAGTGIYASSNMGVSFVVVSSDRTESYQSFNRSKNVLIATSDELDPTLYWAGSLGTFFTTLAPGSAPSAKFSISHQGYLLLLNGTDASGVRRKRGFFYQDSNTQLTGAWTDYFELPSTADDEITTSFLINQVLYVSTKYRLFRVSFIGGNPDWEYTPVREWGFVPRTVKNATIEGEDVVIGLDYNKRIRIFDGVNDTTASDNIESDNMVSEFSMHKIPFIGSGLTICNAELDDIEQEYRLNVAIGNDTSETTHAIVLNLRSLAMYPYSNQRYQAMTMAQSGNRNYLMAIDRSGFVHMLNTGNTDGGVPINEWYTSPFLFRTLPGIVQKGAKDDFYFTPTETGTLYIQDRADFNSNWSKKPKKINLTKANSLLQIVHSEDVPSTHNQYQFKLMSSGATTESWRLTHMEYFYKSMGLGKGN